MSVMMCPHGATAYCGLCQVPTGSFVGVVAAPEPIKEPPLIVMVKENFDELRAELKAEIADLRQEVEGLRGKVGLVSEEAKLEEAKDALRILWEEATDPATGTHNLSDECRRAVKAVLKGGT